MHYCAKSMMNAFYHALNVLLLNVLKYFNVIYDFSQVSVRLWTYELICPFFKVFFCFRGVD